MALLAIYALGLGLPFLLSAIFINRAMGLMNRIKPHLRLIERIMGALLVIVGVALYRGDFARFAYWLLETFPGLALVG
jgi:cytochrome c-type biogenesis protein